MAITVNPYADRAAAQMAVQQQNQPVVEQPYNLFAQQKQAGYPGVNTPQAGPRVAGEAGIVHSVPITEPVAKTAPVQYAGGGQKKIVPITNTDELAAAMGYTSPEEEERLRKASVANQRILAVGDALRHIGNIANTVNYAPAQQFNNPIAEEQARYEKGKALRDKANQTYLAYQQAKAAQDAKQKQWEAQMQYNMEKDARDYQLKRNESEARNNLREAQLNRYQTLMALDEARREGVISDNEYRKRKAELYPSLVQSQIARNNRTGGGRSGGGSRSGGSNMPDYDVVTTYERDDEGRVKSAKKTRTVKHSDGTTSTSTKTTKPQKKALPGQAPANQQKSTKKKLPGM